jgi:4-hydroxy-tetrahydrodipicolinate synthase
VDFCYNETMLPLAEDFLRGSYVPLVTPFRDGAVDRKAYVRLVESHLDAGTSGIVVCGTSGEPSTLTVAERQQLAVTAIDAADGRLPVIVATGSQSLAESLELTTHAAAAGAAGVMVVTPYYVLPPARGLVEYYRQLASATDLPMVLYHIPRRTGLLVDAATIEAIAEACPTLVGIKHSATDVGLVSALVAALGPDFRILGGLEDLSLPMLVVGASGVVSAVANVAPRLVADLCAAVRAGDLDAARAIHFRLLELNQAVFWDTNPIAVKYLLTRVGLLDRNEHRLPMAPATPELATRLDAVLDRTGLA